jgi:hypothetical protein
MKKTIISSVYELRYEPSRSGEVYKNFALLAETLNSLIFDKYDYVIYSNEETIKKHHLHEVYKTKDRPNVKIIQKELNSDFYLNKVNPIREKRFQAGDIYDRIYSVKNYIEVILNKIELLLENSQHNENDKNDSVVWLDAGLFGTSCHNGWRDYMRGIIYGKEIFLDKIFEKVEEHKFIATKGNTVVINYELKDRIRNLTGVDLKLVPGCLFGGTKEKNLEVLKDFKNNFINHIEKYDELISEQEVLGVTLNDKNIKFFEFDDWIDLQKAFLKIMDIYDESKYLTEKCYEF